MYTIRSYLRKTNKFPLKPGSILKYNEEDLKQSRREYRTTIFEAKRTGARKYVESLQSSKQLGKFNDSTKNIILDDPLY